VASQHLPGPVLGRATRGSRRGARFWSARRWGLADIACHVIGCHLNQHSRHIKGCHLTQIEGLIIRVDDVAGGNICPISVRSYQSDLVELSWAWLSRAARCSSELYGGIVTACAVDDSVASPFTAAEVTVNLLVNGKGTKEPKPTPNTPVQ